jgi:hypothetical protein
MFGLFFVGFGSFGNGVENKYSWSPLVSLLVAFLFAVCPYYLNVGSSGQQYLSFIALLLGLVVCVFHVSNFLTLATSHETRKKYPILRAPASVDSLYPTEEYMYVRGAFLIGLWNQTFLTLPYYLFSTGYFGLWLSEQFLPS